MICINIAAHPNTGMHMHNCQTVSGSCRLALCVDVYKMIEVGI